jgi:hypothetical protein
MANLDSLFHSLLGDLIHWLENWESVFLVPRYPLA